MVLQVLLLSLSCSLSPHFVCRVHTQESLLGVNETTRCYTVESTESSVGWASQTLFVSLERERPELQLEWCWNGHGLPLHPRYHAKLLSNTAVLQPKSNKWQIKTSCCDLNLAMEKHTGLFSTLISQCLSLVFAISL